MSASVRGLLRRAVGAELGVDRKGFFDRSLLRSSSPVEEATGDEVQGTREAGFVALLAGDRERCLEEFDRPCGEP